MLAILLPCTDVRTDPAECISGCSCSVACKCMCAVCSTYSCTSEKKGKSSDRIGILLHRTDLQAAPHNKLSSWIADGCQGIVQCNHDVSVWSLYASPSATATHHTKEKIAQRERLEKASASLEVEE